MSWKSQLKGDPVPWLLDQSSPGARYLALRDLKDLSNDDSQLRTARRAAHKNGPIAAVLAEMQPQGYWAQPGSGYNPKYKSTVWSLILLAQLGARMSEDARIARACEYLLEHALASGGQFSAAATGAPSGTADCLQGNLCWALMELGCEDKRLESAYEWMARSLTGDGVAPMRDRQARVRYYAGKCGPNFACGANNKLPCAWGGVKVMLAFSKWPSEKRSALIKKAVRQGVEFLLGVDPARAEYPSGYAAKPSGNWWKFGFPVFYVSDILQIVEALAALGQIDDRRLAGALDLIRSKQDEQGRWTLDYDYSGKTWLDFGAKSQPNKWVTLRALRVLKAAG